jgi:hypothetical protein
MNLLTTYRKITLIAIEARNTEEYRHRHPGLKRNPLRVAGVVLDVGEMFAGAFGADSVREHGVSVVAHEGFDLLPRSGVPLHWAEWVVS